LGTAFRKLALPLVGLGAVGAARYLLAAGFAEFGVPRSSAAYGSAGAALSAAEWLIAAFLLIRLVDILIWRGLVLRRTGIMPPRLLTNLVDVIIWLTAATIITSWVFEQPVSGLVATSGVAVAMVGFALKSLISDMFSGIALTLERPFAIGDWVEIGEGTIGRVTGLSWRATSLALLNGTTVHVPNGRMAELVLRVIKVWRDEIDIELGYDVPEEQVERLLLSAVSHLPNLGKHRRADVKIVSMGSTSIKWRLRFWLPDYASHVELRERVQRDLLRALHLADITVAPTMQRITLERARTPPATHEEAIADFLGRVDLFKLLTPDELAELASGLVARKVAAGTRVVRQGDSGASLFLIREGILDVSIEPNDNPVAHLTPGSFFGEMSLLTGEPRSATVTARLNSVLIEIAKERLQPIISHREHLAEELSRVLEERQLHMGRVAAGTGASEDEKSASRPLDLVGRVRAFFGLSAAERPGSSMAA
jgi:small-conductance mechanosensitive channel/CRP-like cAMP-binding protein